MKLCVIQLTLVVLRSLGLAKLPLYNRNVVLRGQKNKETQSRNEIWDFRRAFFKLRTSVLLLYNEG